MALTPEELRKISEEEYARKQIRDKLNQPKLGEKSVPMVILWTFLFGSFGLFYVDTTKALIVTGLCLFVGLPLAILSGGTLGFVCWIASIIYGVVLVNDYNAKL